MIRVTIGSPPILMEQEYETVLINSNTKHNYLGMFLFIKFTETTHLARRLSPINCYFSSSSNPCLLTDNYSFGLLHCINNIISDQKGLLNKISNLSRQKRILLAVKVSLAYLYPNISLFQPLMHINSIFRT